MIDQAVGGRIMTFGRLGACELGQDRPGQFLAELDAPLVEGVDSPNHTLDEHLVLVKDQRTGQWAYRSRALCARAQVLLELGDGAPAEVERLLLEAVESAGSVDDLQAELIISTHLARIAPQTGKLREAHDRLAGHYARLAEGFDRGPAREAKAALDELAEMLETEPTAS